MSGDKITIKTESGKAVIPVQECESTMEVKAGPGPHKLGDHADVRITSPVSGQVLTFNGTDWVNASTPSLSITQDQIDAWDDQGEQIDDINEEIAQILSTTLPATYHKQGGNTYDATSVIGTNDDFGIEFRTNGLARTYITNTGNLDHHGSMFRHYHTSALPLSSNVQEVYMDGTKRFELKNHGGIILTLKTAAAEAGIIGLSTPGAGTEIAIGLTFVRANRIDFRVTQYNSDLGYTDDDYLVATGRYSAGFDIIRGGSSGQARFAFGHLANLGLSTTRVEFRGLSDISTTYSLYATNLSRNLNTFHVKDNGEVYGYHLKAGAGGLTLPTFTQGSVLFAGVGGVVSQDNANFFYNSSNKRWGFGTNEPANTLHLKSNSSSTSGIAIESTIPGFEQIWRLAYSAGNQNLVIQPLVADSIVNFRNLAGSNVFLLRTVGNIEIRSASTATFLVDRSTTIGSVTAGAARFNVIGSGTTSGTYTAQFHNFTGTNNALMINDAGNIGIGTSSPAARLHARGDSTVSGNAFLVQNSGPNDLFRVVNDGTILIGHNSTSGIAPTDGTSGITNLTALGLIFRSGLVNQIGYGFRFANGQVGTLGGRNVTSGTSGHVLLQEGFKPTSGTAVYNFLTLDLHIDQTGGANGITRGIYVNPTITAAADFRAIETTAGKIIFGGTGTHSGVILHRVTTVQRDAITGIVNGMILYNTSTDKFQGYAAGAWVDLH